MYEDYFGLERPPFKITPDTSLFYEGGKRGDILAALVYAIHRGEGIIKVVGEVGSGKTMLCRMLQLKLPDTVEIVYIGNPSVSPEDILFVIAHELSLPVSKGSSKHEAVHLLQDYLLQRHMENKQVVLFVEEAQGMPLDTLEEIRLLSNLETDQNKLLQIILFGQPELDQNLAQQSIRQLRERITHNFDLEPLTQDEIHYYLNFRMRQVGYTGPELVNQSVAKKVEQHSEGLLRRINIIADKILLSAFAEGTHNLSPKHVTSAVNDSAFAQGSTRKSKTLWWLGLVAVIALALALYQARAQWISIQAGGLSSKPENTAMENAVFNGNSVTAFVAQVVETVVNKTIGEADIKPDTVAVVEQPAAHNQQQHSMIDVEPQTVALVQPVETTVEPIETAVQPVEITVEPIETAVQPVGTAVEQIETAGQAVETTVEPIEKAVKPVETTLEPIEAALLQATDQVTTEPAQTKHEGEDRILQKALDQASSSVALATATATSSDLSLTVDYKQWLNAKLQESLDWLSEADRNKVSIQVLMRSQSAARELVYYLRNEWPLDLSKTYLYQVSTENRSIYRVFFSEFDSLSLGKRQLEQLPESVKVNSPYLHSIYRMQKALL